MCDVCSTDTKWKTPPNSDARIKEVNALEEQKVLDHGHQLTGVGASDDTPSFTYTFGRSIIDKPELLMIGLDPMQMGRVLNGICAQEDEGKIDVLALATDEPVTGLLGDGDVPVRLRRINAYDAEMFSATNMGGKDVVAVQVIWPDAHGNWPDGPFHPTHPTHNWHYGNGFEQQPVHPEVTA